MANYTFTYDQDGGPAQETKQPGEGVDYRMDSPSTVRKEPATDNPMPPGNPGFTNMPDRDSMNPSSGKVIPTQMKEDLRQQLTYPKAAARLAFRWLEASSLCDSQRHSLAWISPKGKVHYLRGQDHVDWAHDWIASHGRWEHMLGQSGLVSRSLEGVPPVEHYLWSEGWCSASNVFTYESHKPPNTKQMRAISHLVADCVIKTWSDRAPAGHVEGRIVTIYSTPRIELTVPDFVKRYGEPRLADKMFEQLLSKTSRTRTVATIGVIPETLNDQMTYLAARVVARYAARPPRGRVQRHERAKTAKDVCYHGTISHSWIDPRGKTHILPYPLSHEGFARTRVLWLPRLLAKYTKKHGPDLDEWVSTDAFGTILQDAGWIRVANATAADMTKPTKAAIKTFVAMVLDCAGSDHRLTPDTFVYYGQGPRKLSDAVQRLGGPKAEEELFERLMARVARTKAKGRLLQARALNERVASRSKLSCIVGAGQFEGRNCLLKVRDRNYVPAVHLIRDIVEGVEIAYLYDLDTDWSEGLSEHGIGVVSSALMVIEDETAKKERTNAPDGIKIRNILSKDTLGAATEEAVRNGVTGHTFLASPTEIVTIEMDGERPEVRLLDTSEGKVAVRTNHGEDIETAGYTKGPDLKSSKSRKQQAEKLLHKVQKVDDLAPALPRGRMKDRSNPHNMIRDTDSMMTSSIAVLDSEKRTMKIYLVPGKVDFYGTDNRLPKGYKPKIKLEVLAYGFNEWEKANPIPQEIEGDLEVFRLFTYGSLMESPASPKAVTRSYKATLDGHHRAFNRASQSRGDTLVVGTEPKGSIEGVVHEYPVKMAQKLLGQVDRREGYNTDLDDDKNAYLRGFFPVQTGKKTVWAVAYLSNPESKNYFEPLSTDQAAERIGKEPQAKAYLGELEGAFKTHGIKDPHISEVFQKVRNIQPKPERVAQRYVEAGLKMVTLEKGSALYHGTPYGRKFTHPNGPAWFTPDRDTASFHSSMSFSGKARDLAQTYERSPSIRKYRFKRDTKLPWGKWDDMSGLLAHYAAKAGLGNVPDLEDAIGTLGWDSGTVWWVFRDEHRASADNNLGPTLFALANQFGDVTEFLQFLCQNAGFKGWIAKYTDGGTEVMLCNPRDLLKSSARQPVLRNKKDRANERRREEETEAENEKARLEYDATPRGQRDLKEKAEMEAHAKARSRWDTQDEEREIVYGHFFPGSYPAPNYSDSKVQRVIRNWKDYVTEEEIEAQNRWTARGQAEYRQIERETGQRIRSAAARIERVAARYRRRLTVEDFPEEERRKLPETTFASDLEFKVKKSPTSIQVDVIAGKATVGSVWAGLITEEELGAHDTLSTLQALGEKVGKDLKLYAVGGARLWKALRGHKAGRKAYLILLEAAAKMGAAVGPEDSWRGGGFSGTSSDAERVWKSIEKLPMVVSEGHFYFGSGLAAEIKKDLPTRPRGFPRGKKKYRRTDQPKPDREATSRTAATMTDLMKNTGADVVKRAQSVALQAKRFSPSKGFWTFAATGSKGEAYTVRLKGVRKTKAHTRLDRAQVKCSCTCNFFRWQGPEHWAKRNGYLYGKPRGTASTPDVRDPKGRHWVCKHIAAALNQARTYRFASEQGWSFAGDPEPFPSSTRVVARWLEAYETVKVRRKHDGQRPRRYVERVV